MLTKLNRDIGIRLKSVRHIYNEGTYLTVRQFANLLDITPEKLLNYESGRSALPINVLIKLYNRGINPIFLLVGEEDVFVNNAGKSLKEKILNRNIDYNLIIKDMLFEFYQKDIKIRKTKRI